MNTKSTAIRSKKKNPYAPKLNKKQRRFIVRANAAGLGRRALAGALGVHRTTIQHHLRVAG